MLINIKLKKIIEFSKLILLSTAVLTLMSLASFAMMGEDTTGTSSAMQRSVPPAREEEDFRLLGNGLKEALRGSSQDQCPQEAYSRHNEGLIPFAQYIRCFLEQYLTENPTHHQHVAPLIEEVHSLIPSQTLSMNALWDVCIRFAQSNYPQSKEEEEFLEETIHPQLRVREGITPDHPFMENVFSILERSIWEEHPSFPPAWTHRFQNLITKMLPLPLYYPFLGKEKLPLSVLAMNAVEDVFPIRIPSGSLRMQGIDVRTRIHELGKMIG